MLRTSRVIRDYTLPDPSFATNKEKDIKNIEIGMIGCVSMQVISKMNFNCFMVVDIIPSLKKIGVIIPRFKWENCGNNKELKFGQDRSIYEATNSEFKEMPFDYGYQVHYIDFPHRQKICVYEFGTLIEDEKKLISW